MNQPHSRHHVAQKRVAGGALAEAAAHLAAAAELLEASDPSDEIFSPARGMAAQLRLIGHGLSPGIAPITNAFAPAGTATAHVDYALTLLDDLDSTRRPADLFLWHSRLSDLRERLVTTQTPAP